MPKSEYDFLTWISFPSSRKMVNETDQQTWWQVADRLPVEPGRIATVSVKARGKDLIIHPVTHLGTSHVAVDGLDATGKPRRLLSITLPVGTFDWKEFKDEVVIPSDIIMLRVNTIAGPGFPERPSETWFDDLKIYQDDKLIYSNDFSNWALVIIPAEIITGVAAIKFIK